MKSLCQPSEIDILRQRLAAKHLEYAKAMKEDKEFSYVKRIFKEIKELRAKLHLTIED